MDDRTKFGLSPEGIAITPRLNSPDRRYSKPGSYWTKLRVPADKAQSLVAEIDARMQSNYEDANARAETLVRMAAPPYEVEKDGSVIFLFKKKACERGYKRLIKIPMFDAKGRRIRKSIGQGSTIRVSFEFCPFWSGLPSLGAGVTLKIHSVQWLSIVAPDREWDAGFFGFGDETAVGSATFQQFGE
jgi:hypothetical protein